MAPPSPEELTRCARDEARRQGFDLVGVTAADPLAAADFYAQWVALGFAGDMAYLARHADKRADPRQLVPGARSVLCLGMHYDGPPTTHGSAATAGDAPDDGGTAAGSGAAPDNRGDGAGPRGRIARYARGDDYHDLIKKRLAVLWEALRARAGEDAEGRWFVDTAPVLERELAARAGLGWWGKNTCLIHKGAGSYFFLAQIISNLPLVPDAPATDHCGTCSRCLDACPTDAFPEPYVLDARRCISYLTIELKGSIPVDLRARMGDWILGCDICQDVCPWNRRAAPTAEPAFHARHGLDPVDLLELIQMDRDAFNERFRGNPAKRPKRGGLLRNAAVALGNSGDARAVPALAAVLGEEPEPVVRGHVAWALGQLGGDAARAALRAALDAEDDAEVRAEIEAALARVIR